MHEASKLRALLAPELSECEVAGDHSGSLDVLEALVRDAGVLLRAAHKARDGAGERSCSS